MKKKIFPVEVDEFYEYFSKNGELPEDYEGYFTGAIKTAGSFAIGPYFWFITNNTKMRTEIISDNIEKFTPYSKKEWLNSDTDFFINLFHPEDKIHIMGALIFGATMRQNFLKSGKTGVRFNYYGRMIDREGEYRWILLHSPQQRVNQNFEVESSLVMVYDLSHFQIQNRPLLSVIDFTNDEVQYFKHVDQYVHEKVEVDKPAITKREKEILKLMAQGLNTPEIAEKLFISYHTVENHKSNLRKKTNTKTSSELIAYTMSCSLLII
ncbi:LuxR C-terminal-related transcriptional regulator [Chryseobacterium sp. BIGb0232]|uniref:LuxR C-terminal-related transcriptional regulator n=1 Tax=Chryseobacterium sp. BIGb0232 TaxID=2940598 RepID=UPI000F49DE72|nr:LuxR C-terminal-related transcriptional regulator [Chryseobacterium sp. BIGb0232]MCS4301174.1 DNA-binding CsgD family transcriptional regulator [Chryseobacterium sp. BIGb0232]